MNSISWNEGIAVDIIKSYVEYQEINVKTDFGGGYTPKNDGDKYRGPINIRQFIETSQNIPALKIMRELTPKKSLEYLDLTLKRIEEISKKNPLNYTEDLTIPLSFSLGVSIYPKDGDNIEDLLNYADEKMYEDKKIRV